MDFDSLADTQGRRLHEEVQGIDEAWLLESRAGIDDLVYRRLVGKFRGDMERSIAETGIVSDVFHHALAAPQTAHQTDGIAVPFIHPVSYPVDAESVKVHGKRFGNIHGVGNHGLADRFPVPVHADDPVSGHGTVQIPAMGPRLRQTVPRQADCPVPGMEGFYPFRIVHHRVPAYPGAADHRVHRRFPHRVAGHKAEVPETVVRHLHGMLHKPARFGSRYRVGQDNLVRIKAVVLRHLDNHVLQILQRITPGCQDRVAPMQDCIQACPFVLRTGILHFARRGIGYQKLHPYIVHVIHIKDARRERPCIASGLGNIEIDGGISPVQAPARFRVIDLVRIETDIQGGERTAEERSPFAFHACLVTSGRERNPVGGTFLERHPGKTQAAELGNESRPFPLIDQIRVGHESHGAVRHQGRGIVRVLETGGIRQFIRIQAVIRFHHGRFQTMPVHYRDPVTVITLVGFHVLAGRRHPRPGIVHRGHETVFPQAFRPVHPGFCNAFQRHIQHIGRGIDPRQPHAHSFGIHRQIRHRRRLHVFRVFVILMEEAHGLDAEIGIERRFPAQRVHRAEIYPVADHPGPVQHARNLVENSRLVSRLHCFPAHRAYQGGFGRALVNLVQVPAR